MIQLFPVLMLRGDQFSPGLAEAETGLGLSQKQERGDKGQKGRYRDQPLPYGAALLEVPVHIEPERRMAWLLEASSRHLPVLRRLGASECGLHLDVRFRDQCNLEFVPEELALVATLGLPLTISCWDSSEEEEAI